MFPKNIFIALTIFIVGVSVLYQQSNVSNAQRPDAPTYAQRGPYAVGTRDLSIEDEARPLEVTVWYPTQGPDTPYAYPYSSLGLAGQALLDAPILVQEQKYPLVVFSHGSGGYRLQSLYLTEHLASYGFVVIAADHAGNTFLDETNLENLSFSFAQRPLDVLRQVEFMTLNNSTLFSDMVDVENIAVIGHSFGGYTALASAGARLNSEELGRVSRFVGSEEDVTELIATHRDMSEAPSGLWPSTQVTNIKAVVGLAPAFSVAFGEEGLASITVPTLLLVGSTDRLTPPESEAAFIYDAISSDVRYLGIFENAGHFIFANACTPIVIQAGFFYACSDPVWDMQRAHDLTNHFTTSFLLAYLQNDTEALEALAPESIDFIGFQYKASVHEE